MEKAVIILLDEQGNIPNPRDPERTVEADFNPQSLRLNFRAMGAAGAINARSQTERESQTAQATNYNEGMTVELLFDTTRSGESVRAKTIKIARMIQAVERGEPPLVVFQWGDFLFRGTIQSMDETVDYFSDQGIPLRSTVSLSISGTRRDMHEPRRVSGAGTGPQAGFSAGVSAGISAGASVGLSASAGMQVGATPLTLAQSGESLQSLAGRAGVDWKAVASANNIDNPRAISAGTLINLNARASRSVR